MTAIDEIKRDCALARRRKESIGKQLLQELETLRQEEQSASHDERALTAWVIADTLSGTGETRQKRIREIKRDLLLLRCGYRLLPPISGPADPSGRIHFVITLNMTRRVGRIAEEQLEYAYSVPWISILDSWSDGHHHMACRDCDEPLLRKANIDHAVYLAQLSTRPAIILRNGVPEIAPFDSAIEAAIQKEYRSVEGGPDSDCIAHCPYCRNVLADETVEEIKDTDL